MATSIKNIVNNGMKIYLREGLPDYVFEKIIKAHCKKLPDNIEDCSIYLYPSEKYKHKKVYIIKNPINSGMKNKILADTSLEGLGDVIVNSISKTEIDDILKGRVNWSDFFHLFSAKRRRDIKKLDVSYDLDSLSRESSNIDDLQAEIERLRAENKELRKRLKV